MIESTTVSEFHHFTLPAERKIIFVNFKFLKLMGRSTMMSVIMEVECLPSRVYKYFAKLPIYPGIFVKFLPMPNFG